MQGFEERQYRPLTSCMHLLNLIFFFRSLQIVSWLVAALVIVINGYLMVDFFSNEVTGVVFTTVVFAFTGAYVAFIIYLISRVVISWCYPPKQIEVA